MAKHASFKELNYEEEIGLNSPMRNVRELLNRTRYFSSWQMTCPKAEAIAVQ